jgi:hypothetical protein
MSILREREEHPMLYGLSMIEKKKQLLGGKGKYTFRFPGRTEFIISLK